MEKPDHGTLAPPLQMSWTLARKGRHMTCRLIQPAPDEYVLRLTHENIHFLDITCNSPHEALSRSLDTLASLFEHGWHQRSDG